MPRIELTTHINATVDIVFDLSRSIELHKKSTAQSNEEAIAGKTSGLMDLHDQVTWRARHFGIYQRLTSKITEFERPTYFVDEMVKGIFKHFRHEHYFTPDKDQTIMRDVFEYASPLGILGKIADGLFLEKYMTRFLEIRNQSIKEIAESGEWKEVLK